MAVPVVGFEGFENDLTLGGGERSLERVAGGGVASDRRGGDDLCGKIFEADVFAFAQQDRAFDDVLQLADVAGPAIALQRGQSFFGEADDTLTGIFADAGEEVRGELRDVAGALAERRELEVDDVDAIEQVLAKTTGGDGLGQNLRWWRGSRGYQRGMFLYRRPARTEAPARRGGA